MSINKATNKDMSINKATNKDIFINKATHKRIILSLRYTIFYVSGKLAFISRDIVFYLLLA